ncbi:MAG: hypothetical protein JXA74_16715 [Anaerolineae bacterium]|nr:hypothetical protein [Anaerolineae bacterium]
MSHYRHTQLGSLTLVGLGLGGALALALLILEPEGRALTGVVLGILLACMFLSYALTVLVSEDELVASFGPGLIRKRFRIADIRAARAVRNPWYFGWGIRLTPRGWLFNVSGFQAVEIELANGRRFRIGTDDPQGLVAAIQMACRMAGE